MLKEDNPIKNIEDDRNGFNRANFAQNLSLNIQNYFNRNPINRCLTIGLMGEWGSGKTSLLNLTENFLKQTDIKIIKFNPWIYSSYNQLVEQFFDELIMEFTDSRDGSLRGYLRKYKLKVNELNLAKNLAIAGASLIDSKLGGVVGRSLNLDSEEKSLKYLKKKISEQFSGRRVVCIIDDLDRLSNKEIAEMFKLIKIMADFNNMIYLVSFDKKVVSKALKQDYGGEKYIEKIINVPLYVPLATPDELAGFLLKEIKRISNKYDVAINYSRLNYFLKYPSLGNVKEFGLIYFFKNMRDIKRVINIFEFNYELIKDEVNFEDFFVITSIQVFNLDLYNKIKYNEFLLTSHDYYDGWVINKDNVVKSKINDFENICGDENMAVILKQLFPMMSFIYNPKKYMWNFEEFDEQLRICHPLHFQTYFKLNDIVKEIPEKEIDEVIAMINNEMEVNSILNHFNKMGNDKLSLFLKYMQYRIKRIDKQIYLLNILFLIDVNLGMGVYRSNQRYIENIIIYLLYKIDKSLRFSILKENFSSSENLRLLFAIWRFINDNNFNPYVADEKLLIQEDLDNLTNIVKEKFNKVNDISPWENSKFVDLMYMTEKLGLIEVNNKIISNSLKTNEDVLSFLGIFISGKEDSNVINKEFAEMKRFCDIELIKNKVNDLFREYDDPIVKNFLKGCDDDFLVDDKD